MPTTTTTNQPPPFVLGQIRNNFSIANQLAARPYVPFNGPRIAPFTQDQQAAFDLQRSGIGAFQPLLNNAANFAGQAASQQINPVTPSLLGGGQPPVGVSPVEQPTGIQPGFTPPVADVGGGNVDVSGGQKGLFGGPSGISPVESRTGPIQPGVPGPTKSLLPAGPVGVSPVERPQNIQAGAPQGVINQPSPDQRIAPVGGNINIPGSFGNQFAPAPVQSPSVGDAASVNAPDISSLISQFQNPFTDQVVNQSLADLRRQNDIIQNQTNQRAAAAGAFGGSRQAILNAENNRNLLDASARASGQLRSQGFNQALGAAGQQAGLGLQAGLANQSADNRFSLFNADQGFRANLANQQGQEFGAGLLQSRQLSDQAAQNRASEFNANLQQNQAGRQLQAAGLFGNLAGQGQNLFNTDVNRLLGIGQQQQQLGQRSLDLAFQDFLRQQNFPIENLGLVNSTLASAPLGNTGTQTTQGGGNTLGKIGSLLGGAAQLGSLFGLGG